MSRPPRRRQPRKPAPVKRRPPETVTIDTLGRQGDGEATLADGTRVFVPFTVPGETVVVQPGQKRGDGIAADVSERISGASDVTPICPLFTRCGGCQVQHLAPATYTAWKRDSVVEALARHGLRPDVGELRSVPLASRRRARLKAIQTLKGLILGFNAARSDAIVDVAECPLFAPRLAALLSPMRRLLGGLLKGGVRADAAISAPDGGAAEILIETDQDLDLTAREVLAAFAAAADIARIAWGPPGGSPEPIVQRKGVVADVGGVAVEVPIGFFQQPSAEGEDILRGLVTEGVAGAGRIADLFSGVGTFALPLAKAGAHVFAADSGADAIRALERAAGQAALGGRVTAEVRDLQERPLDARTLGRFAAVVFDPPRAGARAQAAEIAGSGVPVVVAVSCNPATLGRDLRVLVDGGYAIERVIPVDQFPMSYHVEAVAILKAT